MSRIQAHVAAVRQLDLRHQTPAQFAGRKREDQPSMSGVDEGPFENVLEERPKLLTFPAVNDGMYTVDHATTLLNPGLRGDALRKLRLWGCRENAAIAACPAFTPCPATMDYQAVLTR